MEEYKQSNLIDTVTIFLEIDSIEDSILHHRHTVGTNRYTVGVWSSVNVIVALYVFPAVPLMSEHLS